MKLSSRKLLLLLYAPSSQDKLWVSYDQLEFLLPELSQAGRRSLVSLFKRKGLVSVERMNDQTRFWASPQGMRALESEYPALSAKSNHRQGELSLLLFLRSPKSDPQFRYLRGLLSEVGAISLSRGVYLYPQAFPEKILAECQQSYLLSVVICQIKEVLFGDLRQHMVTTSGTLKIIKSYQEISTKLDELLRENKSYLSFTDQRKKQIFSLFAQFETVLTDDLGLGRHYFPQVMSAQKLLEIFQSKLTT